MAGPTCTPMTGLAAQRGANPVSGATFSSAIAQRRVCANVMDDEILKPLGAVSSPSTWSIFARAFFCVRHFEKVLASPSFTVSTGVRLIMLPMSAAAFPMRPPFCKNSSDSGANTNRVECRLVFAA